MTLTVPKVHKQSTLELRDKNQVAISTSKSAIFLLLDNQKRSLQMKRLSSDAGTYFIEFRLPTAIEATE